MKPEKEITTAHILVTSLCDRDCKYCCNKQYDLNSVPYITEDELSRMKHIYLTGGEPFTYSNPNAIARKLKLRYQNIEQVIVYSNAYELWEYLANGGMTNFIDGVTISVKSEVDISSLDCCTAYSRLINLPKNRLYVFPGYEDVDCPASIEKIPRVWQEEFVPAPNCIFRRL